MAITSSSFLLLALVAVLASRASQSSAARAWVLTATSVLFVASYLDGPLEALPLAALLLVSYGSVELLRRTRSGALLGLTLALSVGVFVVLKQYGFVPRFARLPFPYLAVGLSYVLFRLLHLMIDAQQGDLDRRLPPQQFFNYCASFLTFSAGPIQLYRDFAERQTFAPSQDPERVAASLARVIRGYVKVCVVSAILNYLFTGLSSSLWGTAPGAGVGAASFAACAALYTAYLYANFAGYMDIVIGVGALMGQELPENFRQPFAARSFLEFWSRWHMTLSHWFKLYLFNPLLKRLVRNFPSGKRARYLAVLAFFVTFLVMGIWHGSTPVFVVYGLLLGAGASANKLWQEQATARWGKLRYRQVGEMPAVVYLSRGLTFAYFALALTCLWVDLGQLSSLLGRLGARGVVGSYLALTLGSALSFGGWDALIAAVRRARERSTPKAPAWADMGLAAQILLVLSVGSFFHKAPEFVYRAF